MLIVTGGAGFIGSNLLAELEARGLGPLVVIDELGSGDKWRNLAKRALYDVAPPARLPEILARYAPRVSGIFHLGAISDTTWTDGNAIVEHNIRLSFDLWDWCASHRIPLIYASSAATYGDGAAGFDDAQSCEALARLRPLNLYGWSKHVVDRKFLAVASSGGPAPPHWAGFKFFNVYGPNEYHNWPMRSVALQLFEQINRGEPARLFKSGRPDCVDGGQLRDFVWVDDVTDAMIWMFQSGAQSGVFNVGSGKARSFAELARAVFEALGKESHLQFIDMPPHLQERYQYYTEARLDRLRVAGWRRNTTSLEHGVRAYVRGYLVQEDRYR